MVEETNNAIGKKVKKIRKDAGLTLDDLNYLTGISKTYLSDLETGKADNPSIKVLRKISSGLEIDLPNLLKERKSKRVDSGSYHFPFSVEDMKKMTSTEIKGEVRPKDKKIKKTLKEISNILTDPKLSLQDIDDMVDKVLSYTKWLRAQAKGATIDDIEE